MAEAENVEPQAESSGMTRGRELPVNSKVRRRLFSEDGPPEPYPEWDSHDHLSKIIKTEFLARSLKNELILKGMKWNFDFEAERSLRGNLQWYRKGSSDEWVLMEPTGRTIQMRKRSREPLSGLKFTYEGERSSKTRRLSPHTLALRRCFFTDGRVYNVTATQADDENFTNEFNENPPPEYSTRRGDRPPWYTDDEDYTTESTDPNDEMNYLSDFDEVPNIANDEDQVNTDQPSTSMVVMEKDGNDNQEPSISEDKFEKLHIEENTDITEQKVENEVEDEGKSDDMKYANEATPKNEKKAVAEQMNDPIQRARNDKAKKNLHDTSF